MKKLSCALFIIIAICGFHINSSAQILDKIKNKVKQRTDQKVDKTIDKGLDEVEGKNTKVKTDEDGEVKIKTEGGTTESESLTAYSKYDFIAGEKTVGFEDFANVNIGDFPTRWNTNATAEVVTLNSKEGKWLKINKEGVWYPEFITNFPDNFTLEFDLGVNNGFNGSSFVVNIANLKSPDKEYTDYYHHVRWSGSHALHMDFTPYNGAAPGRAHIQTATIGNYIIDKRVDFKGWDNQKNNFAHISLWRQKERLRIYVNGEKVYDLPKAFLPDGKYNAMTFAMQGSNNEKDYYLLGNIRLAIGAADTRNKLITEGKFVTTGITFDVNSDKLKPESYGVLKEISTVLSENPDARIKIVGHTDSDGDDNKNLDLSKRRATAVKAALNSQFKIDESRMEADGLGESKPLADNKTSEGKAQNRRVEFVKL